MEASNLSGLKPPSLDSTGSAVTGADTPKHRIENKHRRKATLANQAIKSQWTIYQGEFELPVPPTPLEIHRGEMCPSGMALLHPAADLLKEWATYGCLTNTGKPWTKDHMQAAVYRGPHRSALTDDAIAHFRNEVKDKVKSGQAKLVAWDSIKDNPPAELKISPIAAIPHKSKQFRSILDLSFKKKLVKHDPPRHLYIPAPPLDFIYHFTHLLFSCSNTPLLLLLISPSALTLFELYFRNTSPV